MAPPCRMHDCAGFELVGLTLIIVGFVAKRSVLVPDHRPSVSVAPMLAPGLYGATLAGEF